jgi:hypothetical protein
VKNCLIQSTQTDAEVRRPFSTGTGGPMRGLRAGELETTMREYDTEASDEHVALTVDGLVGLEWKPIDWSKNTQGEGTDL